MTEINKSCLPAVSRVRKSPLTWGSAAIKRCYRQVAREDLRRTINPEDKPLTLFYIGPGADIWQPLIYTGATRLVLMDMVDWKQQLMARMIKMGCEGILDWKMTENRSHCLTFMYEGKKRELIFVQGDATKWGPSELAAGYDVLLTSGSETVLFSNPKAFKEIFRALRQEGVYLAASDAGDITHGMPPELFGFVPLAVAQEGRFSYHVVRKGVVPQVTDEIMAEWYIKRIWDQRSHLNDIVDYLNEAKTALNKPVDVAIFITAKINLLATCSGFEEILAALEKLESREKQRECARMLLAGSDKFINSWRLGEIVAGIREMFSAKTEATIREIQPKASKMYSGYGYNSKEAIHIIKEFYRRIMELAG